jgi:hypothetical protein
MTLLIGEAAADAVRTEDGDITPKLLFKHFKRLGRFTIDFRTKHGQWKSLSRSCIEHMRPVTCPLVLISEIQRSGGSLLSQLFDGHPELHAHPHELKIGFPRKFNWPPIDIHDAPTRWLQILFENKVVSHLKTGYKKQKTVDETFLFLFLPTIQKSLFLHYTSQFDSVAPRDVFDAYMTSYFGAWLNNLNIIGEKKYVTGFAARLSMYAQNMIAFFDTYPDGRLISIIRDPSNWYPSAARHKPMIYGNIGESIQLWKINAAAMIDNKEEYGERVCLLRFEDVIQKTEEVMHYLADFLGIEFDPILLVPSFNKYPIKANTSFKSQPHGIIDGTLKRYKTLDPDVLRFIKHSTDDLYRKVLAHTISF